MADVKKGLVKQEEKKAAAKQTGINALFSNLDVKSRFESMLGKKAAGFISSVITLTNNNTLLAKADPKTILSAASMAASLDLPINPSLGFAYIVPYKGVAQFQIGWRGFIQLAQRSGLYKRILVTEVYEGEIEFDRFEEKFVRGEKRSNTIVAYYAMFELLNGFVKMMFVTKEEITAHARKYSQSFNNGPWQTEFDKMAKKTVIKRLIKDWGPMSIEMQRAMESDETTITQNPDGTFEYKDTPDKFDINPDDFMNEENIADAEIVEYKDPEIDPITGEAIPLDLK